MFKDEVRLQIDDLIENAAEQVDLHWKYAEELHKAMEKAEATKHEMEKVEASLQLQCRDDPESFKLKRISEASIGYAVLVHPKLRLLMDQHHHQRHDVLLLQKKLATIETRKQMITAITELLRQSKEDTEDAGYSPRPPGPAKV